MEGKDDFRLPHHVVGRTLFNRGRLFARWWTPYPNRWFLFRCGLNGTNPLTNDRNSWTMTVGTPWGMLELGWRRTMVMPWLNEHICRTIEALNRAVTATEEQVRAEWNTLNSFGRSVMADGIACPYCGCTEHSVLETRTDDDSILRRRQCEACELPFPTHEEADEEFTGQGPVPQRRDWGGPSGASQ